MRVLVTGATGFVGQHLAQLLLSRGHDVYGTYLIRPSDRIPGTELIPCDLRDSSRLRLVLTEIRPSQIYHLAALSSPSQSFENFKEVYEANFWGTHNLLEAVRQKVPRARVLIVGSGQCYGDAGKNDKPLTEARALAPPNPYALSKAAADMLAGQYYLRFGLHLVRARPFNHTGPGQPGGFVCSDYARRIAAIDLGFERPVVRVRDPHSSRDFSDVRDMVRAYELLLRKGRAGEAYNIASGRLISVEQIVSLLASFCSRPIRLKVQRRGVRAGDIRMLRGSSLKLRRATGWEPKYNMSQTLRDLFEYWKLQSGGKN